MLFAWRALAWVITPLLTIFFLNPVFAGSGTMEWELIGRDLHFTITSAEDHREAKGSDCGFPLIGKQCYVQIRAAGRVQYSDYVNLRGMQSGRDIVSAWRNEFLPRRGVITDWLSSWERGYPYYCIFLSYQARPISGSASADFADTCNGTIINPPTVEPPKPPLTCSLDGDIYLRHGTLDANGVNSHVATSTARVSCNRAATVNIKAVAFQGGGSTVRLSANGSLMSRLEVNNNDGVIGGTFNVPGISGNNVIFKSTLITSGDVAAGNFNGSAVAILSIL
ncbi:MrpH family fimbial adhesin [Serratia entomophila]|uniref:MrpH family fimbial adhesin n=1 Tax=Serratia entomophila TaxID=42906 RepID=UPI00217B3939|nr:hypothetical protein [Serratia entomophila]CAI0928244.1 Uncharacterised protein [Serratia entomophila]CAI1540861.1 Uncharacterised protein [Serratia entomophila]CAI1662704.1 Uncharacterised protein [Serratia entomophila]CAI1744103.1 Uncharacterised protein [Serratia entomophila]CAI1774681.1 Uncharacterised protein [Serratia entomophila]